MKPIREGFSKAECLKKEVVMDYDSIIFKREYGVGIITFLYKGREIYFAEYEMKYPEDILQIYDLNGKLDITLNEYI